MVRIKRIGVKQTAKVLAVFYFLISLTFVIPFALVFAFMGYFGQGEPSGFPAAFGGIFLILMPFFYASIGFVMAAVAASIYNFIAGKVGGVEIELEDKN